MFAAATVKDEAVDEASLPAETMTDAERTVLELQECSSDRCNEELCRFQREALAEGVTVPAGWHCSRHLRLSGLKKGTAYTVYYDPQHTIFRSKASARMRMGLSRRKPIKSKRTSTVFAKAQFSEQAPKQTKPGEAVKAGTSKSRLLADLTDANIPPHLSKVHITCVETGSGIRKTGLWYPCLHQVECHAQCCVGKTIQERTMRCSGLHSFEVHCGRNPKQSHWKQMFKVDEEGYVGMSVEKYMSVHGIKLTKPKRSRSPLQQLSAPLVSAQSLHARTSPEPAMAEKASASMPHQSLTPQGSCEADSEGEQREEHPQQQQEQAVFASAATVSMDRRRCSDSVPAADADVLPQVNVPTDAEVQAAHDMALDEPLPADVDPNDHRVPASDEPMEDRYYSSRVQQGDAFDDGMAESEAEDNAELDKRSPKIQQDEGRVGSVQGAGKLESAAGARLKQNQAKLDRDHKNKLRNLRRQLKKREGEVQALQLKLAQPDLNTAPSGSDSGGQRAASVAKDGNAHGESAAACPSNQGGEDCACCKEKDGCIAKLENELADAKAKCHSVQQRASSQFANLMKEYNDFKLEVFNLEVSRC